MPPVCTLCRRPDRAELDAALVAPAEPLRNIAARFGTSPATLLRHKGHLPRALVVAREAEAVTQADTLLEKVHTVEADARRLLEKAERSGDFRCAIAAAKTSLDVIEMLLKVRESEEDRTAALIKSPQWLELREVILTSIEPFPPAFDAMLAAIERAEGKRQAIEVKALGR